MKKTLNRNTGQQNLLQKNFRLFLVSAIILLSSLGGIVVANFYMPPSLKQEIYVLIALVIAGVSGTVTLFAYIKMIFLRLRYFLDKKE